MKTKTISLLFILMLLYGCIDSQKRVIESEGIIEIPFSSKKKEVFDVSCLSEKMNFVKLETSDSCLIQNLRKVICTEHQIIIGDRRAIMFFTKEGKYQRKIEKIGQGPDEYSRLTDFDICEETQTIRVLDSGGKKIIVYDFEGNSQEIFPLDYWAIKIANIGNEGFLLYSGNQLSNEIGYKFNTYNMHNEDHQEFMRISNSKSNYLHIHSPMNFYKNENALYFIESFNDTIYQVNTKQISPRYVVNVENKIPASFYDVSYDNVMEFMKSVHAHSYSYGIFNMAKINENIFFSVFSEQKKLYALYVASENETKVFSSVMCDPVFSSSEIDLSNNDVTVLAREETLMIMLPNDTYLEAKDSIKNEKLREIVDNLKEDDNPILCIIDLRE